MNPAFSVIFFTVSSGVGYGLLGLVGMLVALGVLPLATDLGLVAFGLGVAAVLAGLLSSTFHLGHPERAWRAVSQWRSSWLAREGVAAIASFIPIIMFGYCWLYPGDEAAMLELWAMLTALSAIVTVYCTGMIYQSLRTIHQWHNAWTVPNYLLMAIAGGAIWLAAIMSVLGHPTDTVSVMAAVSVIFAWVGKLGYRRFIDRTQHAATLGSATGLGRFGRVASFETPHTSANYLLKEMGFQIARRHVATLRRYADGLGFALPLLLTVAGMAVQGATTVVCSVIAALVLTLGLVIERWLFFAEAQHVVTLYYGRESG